MDGGRKKHTWLAFRDWMIDLICSVICSSSFSKDSACSYLHPGHVKRKLSIYSMMPSDNSSTHITTLRSHIFHMFITMYLTPSPAWNGSFRDGLWQGQHTFWPSGNPSYVTESGGAICSPYAHQATPATTGLLSKFPAKPSPCRVSGGWIQFKWGQHDHKKPTLVFGLDGKYGPQPFISRETRAKKTPH